MEYDAVTRAQKKKVIDWIASGFERYAAKCTDPSEYDLSGVDIAQIRTKMHRYSEEFDRILRANTDDNGLEMPRLRKDLLRLIDQNCPAVDVVELMVRCTSEFNVALARGLHRFEITQQDLSDLEVCHQQTAKLISELRRSGNSGPSVFFPDLLPEGVRQARRHLENLSERSDFIAERLRDCRRAKNFPWVNAFLKHGDVAFFYRLLKYFRGYRCGCPTLSRLLKAMQRVRQIVDGDARRLPLNRKPIKRSTSARACKSVARKGDQLSGRALQRRLHRFFHQNSRMTAVLKRSLQFYYSEQWAEHRQSGETLMTFFDKLWARFLPESTNSQSTTTQTMPRATPTADTSPPSSSTNPSTPQGARPSSGTTTTPPPTRRH